MSIEEQVLTKDQMQYLKELGVEVKDTALCWAKWTILTAENKWVESYQVCFHDEDYKFSISTLTLQEILEMLPDTIVIDGVKYKILQEHRANIGCEITYREEFGVNTRYDVYSDSFLQAAYKALCWCAKNGYLNKE